VLAVARFPLRIDNDQIIEMPTNAKILSVQVHKNQVCLFALVDPEEKLMVNRRFVLTGTDTPLTGDLLSVLLRIYLGTVQQEEGTVVWHVFEVD